MLSHSNFKSLVFFLLLQPLTFSSINAQNLSKSFSLIKVAKQNNDIRSPWQQHKVRYEHHLATCIRYQGKKALLVTGFAVSHQTEILMLPYFQAKKIPLTPLFVDYEVNLAILTPKNNDDLSPMVPVKVGNDIKVGSNADLLTDQNNIKLNKHSATLSAVDIYEASTSSYQMVHYLFKAQQKALGWSEPVIKDGELVAMTSGQNSDYIYAIPARTIRHFLSDKKESYRGFPGLGFLTQSLSLGSLRKALGVPGQELGVRVAKVFTTSPFFGVVKKNDVLLSLNGHKVNSRQAIEHPTWGETPYVVLINEQYSGDPISIKLWRDDKEIELKKPLKRYLSNERLVRQYNYTRKEPHLIFAGLIFQELSLDYLKTWGSQWQKEAKSKLLYHWLYKNELFPQGQKRIIILSKVLADRKNHGYEHLSHRVISKVNHIEVNSLREVAKALEKPIVKMGKEYSKIEIDQGKGEIILSYQDLEDTHKRIASSYGIDSPESFFRRESGRR